MCEGTQPLAGPAFSSRADAAAAAAATDSEPTHTPCLFDFPSYLETLLLSVTTYPRNRGASNGRAESLSVAETLRAGTVPGVSSPVLRSSASGVSGIFGGARKVEVRTGGP